MGRNNRPRVFTSKSPICSGHLSAESRQKPASPARRPSPLIYDLYKERAFRVSLLFLKIRTGKIGGYAKRRKLVKWNIRIGELFVVLIVSNCNDFTNKRRHFVVLNTI